MALNIKPFFFDNELNFDRKLNLVFDFNLFHEILSHTDSINRRAVWSDSVIPLLKRVLSNMSSERFEFESLRERLILHASFVLLL